MAELSVERDQISNSALCLLDKLLEGLPRNADDCDIQGLLLWLELGQKQARTLGDALRARLRAGNRESGISFHVKFPEAEKPAGLICPVANSRYSVTGEPQQLTPVAVGDQLRLRLYEEGEG